MIYFITITTQETFNAKTKESISEEWLLMAKTVYRFYI